MTTTPDLWRSAFVDNQTTAGLQDSGVVAPTAVGNQFFAVWVDHDNFNQGLDTIIARKFDSLGNPLTSEVNLTAIFSNDLLNPAAVRLPIAGLGDGIAVAFQLNPGGGLDQDIFVVRTNETLNLLENFISIETSPNFADHPAITWLDTNASLLVSYTIHNSGTDADILARRVDANGIVSGPITLFNGTNVLADNSDLATLANGNVVAVFQASAGPTPNDVFFTIRNNAGDLVVSPTPVVGADGSADERDAHVAALADGGFVVTWADEAGDQGGDGIRASVYDANGGIVQSNILVNFFNQAGGQDNSDVTGLPDGGFIVAWEDASAGVDRAQRFDEAGNLVGTPFVWSNTATSDINAATYSDGRAILTNSAGDVVSSIWDTRITDANQTTGENFFGAGGGPADLFLIRDTGGVRQLEAIQTDGTATVFGTVGTNQAFVGSGDFNGDGLSDLLINVDNPAAQTRAFLVDQMNPGGITAQFQIAVRGADWIVDGIGDFNHNGTSDILEHHDVGADRTLEVSVMNNNVVQSNVTIAVNGTNWDVDGFGDFNADGTSDILQHQINSGNETMTLRALSMSPNAVQVQSAPTLGTIGANWQVDGTGDFNGDGTADILIHQDAVNGVRTLQVLTIQNNAVVAGTTIAQVGTNISVDGIGDFNGDGTSDIALHQDFDVRLGSALSLPPTRTDLIYNVVNNTVVNPHTVAVTGIDWHVA